MLDLGGETVPGLVAGDPLARVSVLVPAERSLDAVFASRGTVPFDDAVLRFIEAFGRHLRSDPELRQYPELVALGFWARPSSLRQLRERFLSAYPRSVRVPRGLAFHVAPANVDTIFMYSLLLSMLAGNANIVRVSTRSGAQLGHLLDALGKLLDDADSRVRELMAIVRYGHDRAVTDELSRRADLRVVWGGDETVRTIRQSPLSVGGVELVFPNRYSIAVLDAAGWLAELDKAPLARGFVNDSFWFGQMACSSPRTLVWRGSPEQVEEASASFWTAVETEALQSGLPWEDAFGVQKLLAEQDAAIGAPVTILATRSNRVRIVRGDEMHASKTQVTAGNGFFRESRIEALTDLLEQSRDDWQTIVSHGIPAAEWCAFIANGRPRGIHRVVPFGQALNFDAIWDGVDLLTGMTRITAISVR